jgi:phage terminase small subunit
MPAKKPRSTPRSLGKPGKAFWKKVLDEFSFTSDHQYQLLESACSMLDRAHAARADISSRGTLAPDRFGILRENPSLATERQSANTFRLLCREIGLSEPD